MMRLEEEIKKILKRFRDTKCGGKGKIAAQFLGVTEPTFSRWVNDGSIPKIQTLIVPFERLNARIVTSEDDDDLRARLAEKERENLALRLRAESAERENALLVKLLGQAEEIRALEGPRPGAAHLPEE